MFSENRAFTQKLIQLRESLEDGITLSSDSFQEMKSDKGPTKYSGYKSCRLRSVLSITKTEVNVFKKLPKGNLSPVKQFNLENNDSDFLRKK